MDGVTIPFLPSGFWLLSTAISLAILLILFVYHVFNRQRVAALTKDGGDLANLASKKQMLQADVDALRTWIDETQAEVARLETEQQELDRVRAELGHLEEQCAAKDQANEALRREVGDLENQKYLANQTLERTKREVGDLEAKRAEAGALDAKLKTLLEEVQKAQAKAEAIATQEVKLGVLTTEKNAMENAVAKLRDEAERGRNEVSQLTAKVEQAYSETNDACETLRVTQNELAKARAESQALTTENTAIDDVVAKLRDEAERRRNEVSQLTVKVEEAHSEANDAREALRVTQNDLAKAHAEFQVLATQKVALDGEIRRLEGRVGGVNEPEREMAAYDDLLKGEPACLAEGEFTTVRQIPSEMNALQQFKNELAEEKLMFSPRVIDAFHTSLKCQSINPLTVLAGVSGTGKTLLPLHYAERMGMHRLVMAVQPRWDSPQDMFGFYNYLERKYKATELARSLLRLDPFNYKGKYELNQEWAHDRLLLVLLDEMNLARTEYYFSEFLSKLELRREVKDSRDLYKRNQAELELDSGPGRRRFRLWVPGNVFFVGTMNEDETTQTLSDKVLDRANVLRFGKPDETVRGEDNPKHLAPMRDYLSYKTWRSWLRTPSPEDAWSDQIEKWTKRLNSALDRVGRPFGFRVRLAMATYVVNYPGVEDDDRHKLAFADQVEQKIIPKLRGINTTNDEAVHTTMDEVASVMGELGDEKLSKAFTAAREASGKLGMFQWRGVTRQVEGND